MKTLVPLLLVCLSLAFILAVNQRDDLGKKPNDEEVFHFQERSKVTGELLNVEIVRCRICGQVISYIQSSLHGKIKHVYFHMHKCGIYGDTKAEHYKGAGLGGITLNIIDWLETWQRRLRIRH